MSTRITLDIFSGRKSPEVIVTGDQERELLSRMRPGRELTRRERRPAPLSVLGYRGLVVEQLGRPARGLPKTFRIANGELIGGGLNNRTLDAAVEEFVCGSTGPFRPHGLGEDFFKSIPAAIDRYGRVRDKWPSKPRPWPRRNPCKCAPLYEPDWWNNDPTRLNCNNCYNYSTNYRTDNFAQPGEASGVSHSLTCPTVTAAASADGLINSPGANNHCPDEGHLVAMVIWPGTDYHWYRKGRNGYWSHKPGGTPVTNIDNSGNLISDPRTADRDGYTVYCTFMVVMHGHIKLKGSSC